MFYDSVLASFFLVLFVCSQNNEVVVFCVCVVFFGNKTKWLSCLHRVVLFPFCCLVSNFCFFIPLKKDHRTQQNSKKDKMQKKGTMFSFQLVQLCSQIVFLFGGGLKNAFLLKTLYTERFWHILNRENGPKCQKGWVKTWSKAESKLGASMLRDIIGPSFDSTKW